MMMAGVVREKPLRNRLPIRMHANGNKSWMRPRMRICQVQVPAIMERACFLARLISIGFVRLLNSKLAAM